MKRKKQIVFLEPWPEVMIYKMAKLFKEKGYETISIRILENRGIPDSFFKEAFDKIISFDLNAYKINIKNTHLIIGSFLKKSKNFLKAIKEIFKLKPYVIFARATPNWPCALTKILFRNIPFIYFPYDIRSIGWENKDIAKKHGTKEFELKAERFCFENADGIIHKGHPEELKYVREELLGKNLKIKNLRLNFQPYCSKDFIVPLNKNKLSKKDKEIHTVYIGSIGAVGFGKENYILKCILKLIENKIHVHVYMKSNSLPSKKTQNLIKGDFEGMLKSRYFHLHEPFGPKEIIQEISKYDYGLLLASQSISREHPERFGGLGIGNKTASYFEAGIPCIYDNSCVFVDEIMKKYNLNIGFWDLKEITKIKKNLQKVNYKKLEKQLTKAREKFLMEKNFTRLELFIEKVVKQKYNNAYKF